MYALWGYLRGQKKAGTTVEILDGLRLSLGTWDGERTHEGTARGKGRADRVNVLVHVAHSDIVVFDGHGNNQIESRRQIEV